MIEHEKITGEGRELYRSFDSWSDFVRHATESPCDMPYYERESTRDGENRRAWTGTANLQEAEELAHKGWPKGAKNAYKLVAGIENKLYSLIESPVLRYDVSGELLDVGRYCSGEPEHWGVWDTELREGQGTKHIYLVVNLAASSGVDSKVMTARGACVAALVNLLELAGRRVKLDIVAAIKGGTGYQEFRIPCKPYEEQIDLDLLTMMLAHPATFRRLVFAAMERLPAWYRETLHISRSGNYGFPVEAQTERGDIYLGRMYAGESQWESPESATEWVSDELHKLGVIREL